MKKPDNHNICPSEDCDELGNMTIQEVLDFFYKVPPRIAFNALTKEYAKSYDDAYISMQQALEKQAIVKERIREKLDWLETLDEHDVLLVYQVESMLLDLIE